MANSIGSAAAQGIESGLGMGLRLFDQQEQIRTRQQREQEHATERQERRADRDLQNQRALKQDERLAAQDARLVKQDERQATLDGLKLMDADLTELTNEGAALFSQYGGYDKVPEDVRGDYTNRVRTARQRRAEARRKVYEPTILEQKRDAAEKWSRIQAGQLNVDDMPDDDLVKTLTVMSRRDLSDFLAPKEGGPSKIQQAGLDLQAGIETGNMDLTLKAANVLLAPELRTGVGTDGRDGSEIVSKEIVQLVPHPQDPSRMVPIVKVTVRREDGALGSYVAPITEGRSSDPNDNVKTISMKEAFDRVGQLTTLAEALNRPDVRKRIEKGRETAGNGPEEFLQALSSVGVKPPVKQVTRDKLDLGDRVIEREVDATGRIVGQTEHKKGAAPKVFSPGSGGGGGGGLGLGSRGDSDLTGEEYLATLSADDARIVKGLADGSIKQEAISTKGNRRERMLAMTKQYQADANLGSNKNKDVPTQAQKAMLENDTNVRRAERALNLVTSAAGKDATGLKGYLPNQLLNRMDPAGVDARAAIADLGSLVIHDRSGAAVTAAEFPRLAPFIPTEKDDQATVEKKLKRFVEVYREEMTQLEGTYSPDNGYRPFKVGGHGGSGATGDFGSGPVKLPSDKKAAADAYAKLPSGATFVDPNGVTRRKP